MKHIFKDKLLSQKIGLKGLSTTLTGHEVFGYMKAPGSGDEDAWTLAEWNSRALFHEKCNIEPYGESGYRFFNECKQVTLFPCKNEIRLAAYTSKEYDKPRAGSDPWIHLLLEQKVEQKDRVLLSDMKHVYLTLEFSIDFNEMKMDFTEYNPEIHAAQVSWYFTLENNVDLSGDFEGRPEYMWFGLPMWDNRDRADIKPQEVHMLDIGTNRLIYCMDKNVYIEDGFVEVGKTYRFSFDVLPFMRRAYDVGKANGALANTNWEDLAIGSTNIGWEVPGTFDCQVTLKDMDVTYE